jgi:K+-sensing histidine kinase KdpD
VLMGKLLKACGPVAVCGTFAAVLSVLFRDYPLKGSVPALFLDALVLVSYIAGRTAGLLTAVIGGLVFAMLLFEPYGSPVVKNLDDQVMLVSFAIVSLVMIRISPIPQKSKS